MLLGVSLRAQSRTLGVGQLSALLCVAPSSSAEAGAYYSVIRGQHAEGAAKAAMPTAKLTEPMGSRRIERDGPGEWVAVSICTGCQPKYPATGFPPSTLAIEGGAWGR